MIIPDIVRRLRSSRTAILFPIATIGFLLISAGWTGRSSAAGDESELQWRSYSEALREAKISRKKILVDVYTNWCGWCKKMDRDVYGDKSVANLLSEHFELVKLNAESATTHEVDGSTLTEKSISQRFGVTGYPTTVFLTDAGEGITTIPGYIPKDSFLDILEYIHTEAYKSTSWKDFQKSKGKQ